MILNPHTVSVKLVCSFNIGFKLIRFFRGG